MQVWFHGGVRPWFGCADVLYSGFTWEVVAWVQASVLTGIAANTKQLGLFADVFLTK